MDKISKLNILLKLLIDFVILNYGVHVQHDVYFFQDLTTISHFEQIWRPFSNHFCKKNLKTTISSFTPSLLHVFKHFFFQIPGVSSKRPVSTTGYVDNNQVL